MAFPADGLVEGGWSAVTGCPAPPGNILVGFARGGRPDATATQPLLAELVTTAGGQDRDAVQPLLWALRSCFARVACVGLTLATPDSPSTGSPSMLSLSVHIVRKPTDQVGLHRYGCGGRGWMPPRPISIDAGRRSCAGSRPDLPEDPYSAASRPVDLAGCCRLHPATPGPTDRCGSVPALGESRPHSPAHASPVRRDFRHLHATVSTAAGAPQPSRPGPRTTTRTAQHPSDRAPRSPSRQDRHNPHQGRPERSPLIPDHAAQVKDQARLRGSL